MTPLHDAELKLRASKTKPCARYWARKLVLAQWEEGLIPVAHLSHDMYDELVKQTVQQYWREE